MNGFEDQRVDLSVQYRVLNYVVSVAWIAVAFFAVAHLILGYESVEHRSFSGLCVLLVVFYVCIWKFMFPKVKTTRDLDLLAVTVLTPVIALVFTRQFFFPTSAELAQTTIVLLLSSLVVHSTRLFVAFGCCVIGLLLGIYWFTDTEVGFEQIGHLLFVLPLACLIIRTVGDATYNAVFLQNQGELQLRSELDQTRGMLSELVESKEEMEAKIRHVRAQLESVVELAPITIKIFRRDGQLLSQIGAPHSPGGAQAAHGADDGNPEFVSSFQAAVRGDTTRYVVASDSEQSKSVILRPLFDQIGNVAAVAKISFETGQSSSGSVIDSGVSRASRKMEGLGKLAAGIAHDFNNYLLAIVQFSELINNKLKHAVLNHLDLQEMKQNATAIRKTAVDAARVCDDILTYSGQSRQSKGLHDLNKVVMESKPILQSVIPPGTELEFQFATEPQWGTVDDAMLRRVLVNIVKNSGESFVDGAGKIEISTGSLAFDPAAMNDFQRGVDFVPSASYCCIKVTDNGSGMDQETLQNVFAPYFSKKSGGHGLGMAIAEGIVTSHNGLIRCQSELGKYTTFEILLPRMERVETPGSSDGSSGAREELKRDEIVPRRILVVDDEPTVRTSIKMILGSMGHEVVASESGEEALKVLETRRDFECLVLDYLMPGCNGLELLKKIRAMGIEAPCILCTGCTSDLSTDESLPDPEHILAKPYEFDELQRSIDRVVFEATQ